MTGDLTRTLRQEVSRLQDENTILRDEVLSLRQYLDSLYSLMDAIDQLDPNQKIMPLLDRILYNAMNVIDARDASLLVVDDDSGDLVFVLARGALGQDLIGRRIPSGKGIAGWVVTKQEPTIVNNAPADDRFYAGVDQDFSFSTNSILAVPIIGRGKTLGVIEALNKNNGMPFNTADQTLLLLLCRFAGEILYSMVTQDEQADQPA